MVNIEDAEHCCSRIDAEVAAANAAANAAATVATAAHAFKYEIFFVLQNLKYYIYGKQRLILLQQL